MLLFDAAILLLTWQLLGLDFGSALEPTNSTATKKVYVDLPALPDTFDDAKLPTELINASRCYSMMGCFEPVPISSWSLDPYKIQTEFLLHARNIDQPVSLKFEMVENCLKESTDDCKLHPFDLQSILDSPYEVSRRTIILVSGFLTKAPTDWETKATKIWLELEDVNVIIVNWSSSNGGAYSVAATNTRLVSRQITVLLYYLAKLSGLDLTDDSFAERIYMVGHSLGAHVAGFVGTDLGGMVGRITGLDPAGPNFDELDERFRLDRRDAQLVDAIHSNGGALLLSTRPRFGTGLMSGHIDLYANDGTHQPGCKIRDLTGCSHGKSNKYYVGFLQHELAMRKYLNDKYTSLYRLNAFSSDHYDKFQNATSLSLSCPKSVVSDHDLFSTDLDACSIPVDYFTWFSHIKEELQAKHGIDFSPESRTNNSYFFYTGAETNDQMDHFLVKIRIARTDLHASKSFGRSTSKKALSYQPNECDISFNVQMKNGLENKQKIEQYRLMDHKNHYKIIAPFLSANIVSKYRASKLDAEDFYLIKDKDKTNSTILQDVSELRKDLLEVFPESITLSGFHIGEEAAKTRRETRENPGFLKSLANIFNMVRGKNDDDEEDETKGVSCNLIVQGLAVRPLKRFHRNIVAYYSTTLGPDEVHPKIIILTDNETMPEYISGAGGNPMPAESTSLQLDSIYIGPYDKSLTSAPKELDLDEILPLDATTYEMHISSEVTPTTWMVLTVFLLLFILAIATITSFKVRKVDAIDKQALLLCSVATISQTPVSLRNHGSVITTK